MQVCDKSVVLECHVQAPPGVECSCPSQHVTHVAQRLTFLQDYLVSYEASTTPSRTQSQITHPLIHQPIYWRMTATESPVNTQVQKCVTCCHFKGDCLCAMQGMSVPVARVNVTDFQETVDQLHDYLLQCMALAMGAGPK